MALSNVELTDLRRGDTKAWSLIHEWVQQAAASFRPVLAEEWEDAVQEAEIKLLRTLRDKSLGDEVKIGSLAWRVTRNACVDQLRRRKVRSSRPLETVNEPRAPRAASPAVAAERSEQRSQISRLLMVMPEECRKLLGRVHEGKSYSDLAWESGLSPGALRVRVHRCRQRASRRLARLTTPIVAAAQRLFLERGYVRTPLGDIAQAAGMTSAEVEDMFDDKSEILWEVGKRILTGKQGVSLEEMDFARPLGATDDLRHRIYLATGLTGRMFERGIAEFENLVFEAVRVEPRHEAMARRMVALQQWIGRTLVENLLKGYTLRRSQSVESLARATTGIDSAENYRRLNRERGWPPEEIRRWKQRKIEQLVLG